MQNCRLSHFLGNHDLAIFYFMKSVTCNHQSPANQANFLKEFLYIVVLNWCVDDVHVNVVICSRLMLSC